MSDRAVKPEGDKAAMRRWCLRPWRVPSVLLSALAASLSPLNASGDEAPSAFVPSAFDLPETAVIGGANASIGQFPSIVALVSPDVTAQSPAWGRQFCGGTVVGERWVLTAAHCVHRDDASVLEAAQLRIVEGSLDLGLSGDPVDELIVTNVVPHPLYDHNSFNPLHDVALLEMANVLQSAPVALFRAEPEDFAGASVQVAGWGATVFDSSTGQSGEFPFVLQQASLPLVSRDTCNAPESYDGLIEEGQVCAGFAVGGVDACVGDSGGPLYIERGNEVQQIGITSFGAGCALPDFYGVYTNVSFYADWLDLFLDDGTVPLAAAPDNTDSDSTDNLDERDEDEIVVAQPGGGDALTGGAAGDSGFQPDQVIGSGGGGSAAPLSVFMVAVAGGYLRRRRHSATRALS